MGKEKIYLTTDQAIEELGIVESGTKDLSVYFDTYEELEKLSDVLKQLPKDVLIDLDFQINKDNITYILQDFFKDMECLHSIIIPEGIERIYVYSFMNCSNLQEVTIPSTVTVIGERVFSECVSLENINIPDSVKSIGFGTFFNCKNLKTINKKPAVKDGFFIVNDKLISFDKSNIFSTSVTIPKGVTSIEPYAFGSCDNLTEIIIPNTVKRIGRTAFYHCEKLKEIVIPDSVVTIEYGAFSRCTSLERITIPEGLKHMDKNLFSECASLKLINNEEIIDGYIVYKGDLIGFNRFVNTDIDLVIPDGVNKIDVDSFVNCKKIESIVISDSVTEICEYAFYNCVNLRKLIIPKSVVKIGHDAFKGCEKLKEVFYDGKRAEWVMKAAK